LWSSQCAIEIKSRAPKALRCRRQIVADCMFGYLLSESKWVHCTQPPACHVHHHIRSRYHDRHKFKHHAPACLMSPKPPVEEALPYMSSLVAAHTTELLEAGPYKCVGCSKTANDLFHKPTLSCSKTKPRVIDFAQPVCSESSTCEVTARQRVQAFLDKTQGGRTAPVYDCHSCAMCSVEKGSFPGTKSGMLQCGRCKALPYCSKSCQRAHWPVHKHACVDGITLPAEWQFD